MKKSERKGRRSFDTAIEYGTAAMVAWEKTRTAKAAVRATRLPPLKDYYLSRAELCEFNPPCIFAQAVSVDAIPFRVVFVPYHDCSVRHHIRGWWRSPRLLGRPLKLVEIVKPNMCRHHFGETSGLSPQPLGSLLNRHLLRVQQPRLDLQTLIRGWCG